MDILGKIEKLAEYGRKEETPCFDVSEQVVRQIRLRDAEGTSLIALDLFAGVSVVAASVVLAFAVYSWMNMANPITELWAPVEEMLLW